MNSPRPPPAPAPRRPPGGRDPLSSYDDVRALRRGLSVMEVLCEHDQLSMAELSALTGIDRGTMYRLVATLVRASFAEFDAESGLVSQGPRIGEIAWTLRTEERFMQHVRRALDAMTRQILWPGDFAMIKGGAMIIRASSHRQSPMAVYRRLVGQQRSITRSSLGLCILTAMTPAQRDDLLAVIRAGGGPDAEDLATPGLVEQRLAATRAQGFGFITGLIDPRVAGVGLPVRLPGGQIGAVNLVTFASVVRNPAAAQKLLPALRACAAEIEARAEADAAHDG